MGGAPLLQQRPNRPPPPMFEVPRYPPMFEVSRLQINMAPPVISKDIVCNKGANSLIVIAVEPSAYSGKWSGNTGTELLGGRGHYPDV